MWARVNRGGSGGNDRGVSEETLRYFSALTVKTQSQSKLLFFYQHVLFQNRDTRALVSPAFHKDVFQIGMETILRHSRLFTSSSR